MPGDVCSAEHAEFERLIAEYKAAFARWLETVSVGGDLVSDGPSFEQLDAVSRAILRYPCRTSALATRKIAFVLGAEELHAILKEDEDDGEDILRLFLVSIIPPGGAG